MPANIGVMPAAERKARIDQTSSNTNALRIRFRGALQSLPGKKVPLNLPIYRMANTRTMVRQREYAQSSDLAKDYFGTGQENQEAQAVQHTILIELAKSSRANIYRALEEQAEQSEPLILTNTGVILNGNRRLAAMRELYAEDPARFGRFSDVEVAVLPKDANEDDLTAIETALQIAPDLRLDYGWVEEALSLKRQIEELRWDVSRASNFWDESEADLNARLNRLTMAEEYLVYRGDDRYSLVADDEQAFSTLQQRQDRKPPVTPTLLEAERLVLYAVIFVPEILERRAYDYARTIDLIAPKVLEQLSLVPASVEGDQPAGDDPLAGLPADPAAVEAGALEYLREISNAVTIATLAVEARNELDREKKAGKRANEFLRSARQINSTAASMSLTNAAQETIGPAVIQLVASLSLLVRQLDDVVRSHPEVAAQIDRKELDTVRVTLTALVDQLDE